MHRHLAATALAAALTLSTGLAPAAAQQAATGFSLELNNAQSADTGCRLTYVATNNTGVELTAASYEVAVFDGAGVVSKLLILEFGRLQNGKRKVVQFDLADTACDNISLLLVNNVSECTAADGSTPDCLGALTTSSRAAIEFGV
jgi:hypothetical protein